MRVTTAPFLTALCVLAAGTGCHVAIGLGDYQESGGAGGTTSTGGMGGSSSSGGMGGAGGAGGNAFNPNWDGRIALDVTTSNTSELTNVFIPLTLEVPSAAHDLLFDQAGGTDFALTESNSTQILQTDVESYDGTRLVVWVEMPSLPSSADPFRLYLYFGNADAPTATWPAHEGVYHMSLRPTLGQRRADHSGNERDSSNPVGTQNVPGVVGTGLRFPTLTARVALPYTDEFAFDAVSFSLSAWLKDPLDITDASQCAIYNGGTLETGGQRRGYALGLSPNLQTEFFYSDGTNQILGSMEPSASGWMYLAAVVDKDADEVRLYRDGALVNTETIPAHGATASAVPPSFSHLSCSYQGELDEVRFVSRVLSANEIRGDYEVIKTPPVVEVVGDVETAP